MGYKKTRLEHIIGVYRETREIFNTTKLQLQLRTYKLRRANPPSSLAHTTAWDDDDESSDEYNPESPKKRRLAPPKTPKAKRLKTDTQLANPIHTSPEANGPFPTLVTLKFKSTDGKLLLNRLAGQHGTGYGTSSSSSDEMENGGRARKTFLERQDEESGKIGDGMTRSGLKRRLSSPTKIPGCTGCKQANKKCSAKISGKLPCGRCQSENVECIEYNGDEAMKVEDAKSKNTSTSTVTVLNTTQTSSPSTVTILNTTQTSTCCPTGERPVDHIRKHFSDIQALGQSQKSPTILATGQSAQNPIILDSRTPSPEPTLASPTNIIKTRWAHPIDFKHDAMKTGTPCHFCEDFRYGIYGYGVIEVEVYQFPGDSQWHEAGNGHLFCGRERTRMCVLCALKRLHTSRCTVHSLKRFGQPSPFRIERYRQQLVESEYEKGPSIKCGVYYTCSLCSHPAFWRCVADQQFDRCRKKLGENEGKARGCGLLLCESCAENLEADNGVLKKSTVHKKKSDDCRRADMDFLFAGSMLHQAYK